MGQFGFFLRYLNKMQEAMYWARRELAGHPVFGHNDTIYHDLRGDHFVVSFLKLFLIFEGEKP
jgi:hypothetical protein